MAKRVFKRIIAAFLLMLLFVCCGCREELTSGKKDMDFTVCDSTKVPDELSEIIEEKKHNIFKLTYINNGYLYIAIGYGEHSVNNLSVVVDELYSTDNAIYVETSLYTESASPTDSVSNGEASMYPYIVLKCEKYDMPVVFDIN